jgi:hypothetical protein
MRPLQSKAVSSFHFATALKNLAEFRGFSAFQGRTLRAQGPLQEMRKFV